MCQLSRPRLSLRKGWAVDKVRCHTQIVKIPAQAKLERGTLESFGCPGHPPVFQNADVGTAAFGCPCSIYTYGRSSISSYQQTGSGFRMMDTVVLPEMVPVRRRIPLPKRCGSAAWGDCREIQISEGVVTLSASPGVHENEIRKVAGANGQPSSETAP